MVRPLSPRLARWLSPKRAAPPASPTRPTPRDVAKRLLSPPRKRSPRRRRSKSPPVRSREYAYWRSKRTPPGPSPLSQAYQRLVVLDAFGQSAFDERITAPLGMSMDTFAQRLGLPRRTQYQLVQGRTVRDVLGADRVSSETVLVAIPPGARLP